LIRCNNSTARFGLAKGPLLIGRPGPSIVKIRADCQDPISAWPLREFGGAKDFATVIAMGRAKPSSRHFPSRRFDQSRTGRFPERVETRIWLLRVGSPRWQLRQSGFSDWSTFLVTNLSRSGSRFCSLHSSASRAMLRFLDISTLFSTLVVVFGLITSIVLLVVFGAITSIVLHELGHLMMCWLLRFQVQAVIIWPVAVYRTDRSWQLAWGGRLGTPGGVVCCPARERHFRMRVSF
jgi:hypothetical protein